MVAARHRLHGNSFHFLSRFCSAGSAWCSFPAATSPAGVREEGRSFQRRGVPDSESLNFLSFPPSLPKFKEAPLSWSGTRTSPIIPANGTVRDRSRDELELQPDALASSLQINPSDQTRTFLKNQPGISSSSSTLILF